jgi:hypothetical protein
MHPLIHDTNELKISELENRISDLTRKYFSTANPELRNQIVLALDTYKMALSRRQQEEYEKMIQSRDKGLDKLIKVN